MSRVHVYDTTISWSGTTGVGYEAYSRDHRVAAGSTSVDLALTADPAFGGDPIRWNPEQLLVAAASSCQLLSFLAVAARARLDVVDYLDDAHGEMPEAGGAMSITRITLRPQVGLADNGRPRPDRARLTHLTELAHQQCFIANSLRGEVVVAPTFNWRD